MPRRSALLLLLVASSCGGKASETTAFPVVDAGASDTQQPPPDVGVTQPPCEGDPGGAVTIASLGVPDSGFPFEGLAILADRGDIYWSVRALPDTTQGLVLKVPRCGGPLTTIASAQDDPTTLAVQGDTLFWGTMGDDNSGMSHGTVVRAPRGGGTATTLVTNTAIYTGAMAVDAAYVYVTGWSSVLRSPGAWKVPASGGPPVGIGPDQLFTEVAVDASTIFLAQAVTDASMSRVLSLPVGGGNPTIVVPSGVAVPAAMVLDDTSLYYMAVPSTLMRLSKNGGTPTALGSVALKAMAVDATYVYWLEGDATTDVPNAVKRMPKGGGPTTTLSTSYASAIAVDEAYVYWLSSKGDVVRLAK